MIKRGFALAERSTLAIWLTPKESATIAPRLSGRVRILDIPNLAALNEALAAGRADAVLASAARLDARCVAELARVRRAFPGVPLLGLVTHDVSEGLAWRAATLGRLGAEVVADLSASSHGWPSIGSTCHEDQDANCMPEIPNSTTQDFSWMLGLMPYGNTGAKSPTDRSQSTSKN